MEHISFDRPYIAKITITYDKIIFSSVLSFVQIFLQQQTRTEGLQWVRKEVSGSQKKLQQEKTVAASSNCSWSKIRAAQAWLLQAIYSIIPLNKTGLWQSCLSSYLHTHHLSSTLFSIAQPRKMLFLHFWAPSTLYLSNYTWQWQQFLFHIYSLQFLPFSHITMLLLN